MHGAALHEHVARLEMHFVAFLQLHVDLARKDHGVVDESVRCTRGAAPGENSTTRKTVPPASVVPTFRLEVSASPELSTGFVSVVQITQDDAPGRFDTTFFATSSIFTTARPPPSWPVTTRRTFTVMSPP